jgi:hypothetical protein
MDDFKRARKLNQGLPERLRWCFCCRESKNKGKDKRIRRREARHKLKEKLKKDLKYGNS